MSEAFDEDEMKDVECQKDAEERLVANRRGLGSNPATVKEGLDYCTYGICSTQVDSNQE